MWIDGLPRVDGGEFGGGRLTEYDHPRCSESSYARGVRGRAVASVDRRAVCGRHVGRVDDILDPDSSAVEKAGRLEGIGRLCRRDHPSRLFEPRPGADRRFTHRDAVEIGTHRGLGGTAFSPCGAPPGRTLRCWIETRAPQALIRFSGSDPVAEVRRGDDFSSSQYDTPKCLGRQEAAVCVSSFAGSSEQLDEENCSRPISATSRRLDR
jgi:hypothetical protein